MIADLLDPTRERINVSDLTNDAVVDYEDEMEIGGIRLERDIAPGVHVRGAERLFEAIMGNLIENAISFSPRDGRIRLTVRRAAANAEIVIEDSGPGVPAGDLERIFEQNFSRRLEAPPCGGRTTLAPRASAISTVRSVLPASTTQTSDVQPVTVARACGRLASSSRVSITTASETRSADSAA